MHRTTRAIAAGLLLTACAAPTTGHSPGSGPHGEPNPQTPGGACAAVDVTSAAGAALDGGALGITVDATLSAPSDATLACALVDAPPVWRQLVPFGSTWRLHQGSAAPDGWTAPGFDDSAWSSARAAFAVADFGAATTLYEASSPLRLRAVFSVDDPAAVQALTLAYHADDGLVVWLNGVEIARDNVPALAAVDGVSERLLHEVDVSPAALAPGVNTLAVEVHSAEAADDPAFDLGFDLRLFGPVAEPPDPAEVHRATSVAPASVHTLSVFGLLADADYACTVAATCPGDAFTLDVHTPALPFDAPRLAVHPPDPGAAPPWGTYTLFNHQRPCADDHANRLFIVDPDGRVRWAYGLPVDAPSSIDIESAWLGDGSVLWGGGEEPEGVPQIVGLDHTVLHTAAYPGVEQDEFHHDIERTSEGVIGLVTSEVHDGRASWDGFGLVRYDPDTQLVSWRWEAQTAYDRGQLWAAEPDQPDPYHANALAWAEDVDGPAVYVSLLHADAVARVDATTGDVTWTLGRGRDFTLVDPDGAPLPDDLWFDGQHGLQVYGDRVFLYENGKEDHQSKVVVLTLDPTTRTATLTYTWTEPGWFEPLWGDVDELPNGAIGVAMAHNWCNGGSADHPGALLELDPADGRVGFRLDFLGVDDATYRAQRIDACGLFANGAYCR